MKNYYILLPVITVNFQEYKIMTRVWKKNIRLIKIDMSIKLKCLFRNSSLKHLRRTGFELRIEAKLFHA